MLHSLQPPDKSFYINHKGVSMLAKIYIYRYVAKKLWSKGDYVLYFMDF